jgi:hypothetical protein
MAGLVATIFLSGSCEPVVLGGRVRRGMWLFDLRLGRATFAVRNSGK